VISAPIFFVRLGQVFGRNRGPIFHEWIGRGFALHPGNSFFNLANDFAAPSCECRGVRPFLAEQKFFGDFEAIASGRRIFQFWINITGVVMFAVTAEPE
jgi:hypothetical protein